MHTTNIASTIKKLPGTFHLKLPIFKSCLDDSRSSTKYKTVALLIFDDFNYGRGTSRSN